MLGRLALMNEGGLSRRSFLTGCAAAAGTALLPRFAPAAPTVGRPNILFILADDFGMECLGSYGGTSYPTSNLDALAKTGVRFTRCYSNPLCSPSRVALMTGQYNYRNYRGWGVFDPKKERTFAHMLKDGGYATSLSGKWQFDSFENARERIKLWIQYYNHKRPNQGIDGLCPADRFFEIQSELRKTIEAGIKDNLLEMALRGAPRAPFYMVGRMEGQSVVLRAEKGKLKLELSDPQTQSTKELVYELNQTQSDQRQNQIDSQSQTPHRVPIIRQARKFRRCWRCGRTGASRRRSAGKCASTGPPSSNGSNGRWRACSRRWKAG